MDTKSTDLIVQGDVFLTPCKIPDGAKKLNHKILARGEATGHIHAATENAELYEKDGVMFLRSYGVSQITHQEHFPVTIWGGEWRIGAIKEVDPFTEEIRNVRD